MYNRLRLLVFLHTASRSLAWQTTRPAFGRPSSSAFSSIASHSPGYRAMSGRTLPAVPGLRSRLRENFGVLPIPKSRLERSGMQANSKLRAEGLGRFFIPLTDNRRLRCICALRAFGHLLFKFKNLSFESCDPGFHSRVTDVGRLFIKCVFGQRLKNIRGIAFRPQASRTLSRSGVYVSPLVWLS